MSGDQNAGWSHNMKTDDSSFEGLELFKYLGTTLTDQNSIQEKIRLIEVREFLLSFGAESFVFHFAIQKYKDSDVQNYSFDLCFVWEWNLVTDTEGGM